MNNPRKVLHVVSGMNRGGVETLIMNIYREMDKTVYQFDFVMYNQNKCHYEEEIRTLGGNIFRLPPYQKNFPGYIYGLYNTIKKNGPYIAIHSHLYHFSGIVLKISKMAGIKNRISHSHSTRDRYSNTFVRRIYRKYLRKLVQKYSTYRLGASVDACEALYGKRCMHDRNIIVFPNSINIKLYEPSITTSNGIRGELKLSHEDLIIGHVGRFSYQKNHLLLIEIFNNIYAKVKNARLLLVGDGAEKYNTMRLVKDYQIEKNVYFLGVREDIPDIMKSIDVFVLPSLYEGLGIVLIEAQAAGKPCVVSDVVPDEADLKIGLLKKISLYNSAKEWAKTIIDVTSITSPDWHVREKSLIQSGYDVRTNIHSLYQIYDDK